MYSNFLYYIDPCIFPALSEHLVHALSNISVVSQVSFKQVSQVSDLFVAFEKGDVSPMLVVNDISIPIIFCLSNEFAIYEELLHRDYPIHILSPLWVLSSALCRRLQPMVRSISVWCFMSSCLMAYYIYTYIHSVTHNQYMSRRAFNLTRLDCSLVLWSV